MNNEVFSEIIGSHPELKNAKSDSAFYNALMNVCPLMLRAIDPANITAKEYRKVSRLAVRRCPIAFAYIAKPDYNLCSLGVRTCNNALRYIDAQILTHKQYLQLCKLSEICYIDTEAITTEEYYDICIKRLEKHYISMKGINFSKLSNDQAYDIYMRASDYYSFYPTDLKAYNGLSSEQITELYKRILYRKPYLIEDIPQTRELCLEAVKQTSQALQYINFSKLSIEDAQQIYLACFETWNESAYKIPDEYKQFCLDNCEANKRFRQTKRAC